MHSQSADPKQCSLVDRINHFCGRQRLCHVGDHIHGKVIYYKAKETKQQSITVDHKASFVTHIRSIELKVTLNKPYLAGKLINVANILF